MKLYHCDLGFPSGLYWPNGLYPLKFGVHAVQAADHDNIYPLPAYVDTRKSTPIEIGIEDGKIVKILYRIPLDNRKDLCIVVDTRRPVWYVITVWTNDRTDRHRTLNKSRYERVK